MLCAPWLTSVGAGAQTALSLLLLLLLPAGNLGIHSHYTAHVIDAIISPDETTETSPTKVRLSFVHIQANFGEQHFLKLLYPGGREVGTSETANIPLATALMSSETAAAVLDVFCDGNSAPSVRPWGPSPVVYGHEKPISSVHGAIRAYLHDTIISASRGEGTTNNLFVLLSYEDSSGVQLHHPTLTSSLDKCTLRIRAPHEQESWPLRMLVDSAGSEVVLSEMRLTRATPVHELSDALPPLVVYLQDYKVTGEDPANDSQSREGGTQNDLLSAYPSVQKSWNSMVPPMPNYCGLRDGKLADEQVHALQAYHESAFLETGVGAGVGIPGLDMIMKITTSLLLPPIMNPLVDQVTAQFAGLEGDSLTAELGSNIPESVLFWLEPALGYNVSNLLADALTTSIGRETVRSVTADLGDPVAESIVQTLRPRLLKSLAPFLERAVPTKLGSSIPYLLERSLPVVLTERLTKSITHSLVPALSKSLTHDTHQQIWCHYCFNFHKYCNYCHDSPQSSYYNAYYSTYYSDFFSDYYAKYYADALVAVDKAQHPPEEQGDIRKMNQDAIPSPEPKANEAEVLSRPITAAGATVADWS